jgi:hypothetical protein
LIVLVNEKLWKLLELLWVVAQLSLLNAHGLRLLSLSSNQSRRMKLDNALPEDGVEEDVEGCYSQVAVSISQAVGWAYRQLPEVELAVDHLPDTHAPISIFPSFSSRSPRRTVLVLQILQTVQTAQALRTVEAA